MGGGRKKGEEEERDRREREQPVLPLAAHRDPKATKEIPFF